MGVLKGNRDVNTVPRGLSRSDVKSISCRFVQVLTSRIKLLRYTGYKSIITYCNNKRH